MSIRLKFTLVFYLVILIVLGVMGYIGYTSTTDALHEKASVEVGGYTNKINEEISAFLELTRDDLGFFSASNDLLRHLYWKDLGEEHKADRWKSSALNSWQDFVRNYDYIYRVRFLNLDGHEQIVVRRDPVTRKVRALAEHELQDKSGRNYFREAIKLGKDQISVTPMSLNREHGKIEKPHVPVVRISRVVYGENNVKYGILVLNLFADAFFDYIRQSDQQIESGNFYLINRQGDFLYHPDSSKSFGQLLGHSENFQNYYPGVLEKILHDEDGTIFSHGAVIAFKRIFPHPGNRDHYWILVGAVDETEALSELADFHYVFIATLVIVIIMVFLASRSFLQSILTPLTFVTRQLQRLSLGNVVKEGIEYHSNDEIRQILDSTDRLISNTENVASQADVISRGDFTGSVQLLSENDRLGKAINNMTEMLRQNKNASDRQNWLKDGISQLNLALTNDLTPQQLADKAITVIGRYLEAGRGVCYLFDKDNGKLNLLGSYMYTERANLGSSFKLGEGAIGQVAVEKQPIILTIVSNDSPPVTTGTSSVKPLHTYTFPLLRENELQGVIELASFSPFNEIQQEFLANSAEVIASFLYAVLQRERIEGLLEISEQATREAQEQSRLATEANAQLEEQQQQLQQQTEELMQANTQMEEQQQQLQQQTEELQQTNAQMEEQQQQLQQQAVDMEVKNSELLKSKQELDIRAQELEQASQYKSEFLANMSHELRTPLNSIILLSKLLSMNEDSNLSEEEEKRAVVIHQAGEELLRLINDILDLSKIEAGKMELHVQDIPVDELLDEFKDLFEETARTTEVGFKVENRLQQVHLNTDRDKLSQIIRNLLSNAFKFTSEGTVSLVVDNSGRKDLPVKVSVIDTGIGIPEDKRLHVFEAFQQVDGSVSRQYGGTGLGLSISLRFANLLGGTIELDSEEGKGSSFSILLPIQLDMLTEQSETMTMQKPAPQVPSADIQLQVYDDRQNLKSTDSVILLIDDDSTFAESVVLINRKLGYKTLIAGNGEEALRMAKTYRPQGILLDLGLPDMDGSDVLRELKMTRELRRIPVYIVSGRDKEEASLKQGIVGYLQKPVEYDQLADAEEQVLDLAQQPNIVLVVEGQSLSAQQVSDIIPQDAIKTYTATDSDSAIDALSNSPDLAVVDIDRDPAQCLEICRSIKQKDSALPVILYGGRQPGAEEEAELQKFSDSIVIKTPMGNQRMLENIERFLADVPQTDYANGDAVSGADDKVEGRLKDRHILVVDDDPRNLFVITSALEQAGASVETALNGAKALEHLNAGLETDVIFMDIMMPDMDGYEAIQTIKSNPSLKQIPIVALTAKALRTDKEKVLTAGADDYLSKPVDYEVLVNMAAVWCESKR